MGLLYGVGRIGLSTTGLAQDFLLPPEPMGFSITGESESIRSTKFSPEGKRVTAGSAIQSENYTMSLEIEAINWLIMQLAYGELSGKTASVSLPEVRYATVPLTTPFEITDTDITTTSVQASIMTAGTTWGGAKVLERVTTAPTVDQFSVNTSGTKLVFNSAHAGASVAYRLFKTHTNLESIGAETVFQTLSAFSFSGVAFGDTERYIIRIPKLTKSGIPSLEISDVSRFTLDFDLVSEGGARRPFDLFRVPLAA